MYELINYNIIIYLPKYLSVIKIDQYFENPTQNPNRASYNDSWIDITCFTSHLVDSQ